MIVNDDGCTDFILFGYVELILMNYLNLNTKLSVHYRGYRYKLLEIATFMQDQCFSLSVL